MNANWSHSRAQTGKHQQFSEWVSLSLWPLFFLHSQSLHLCLTVSFPLPGPSRTSLSFILILFHASSFSRSVLIHHLTHTCAETPSHPPPPPLPSNQPCPIQTQPSLGSRDDTLRCDSTLHQTPFGIHHTTTSPSHWDTSEKHRLQSATFYFITVSCPFDRALNKNVRLLVTKGYTLLGFTSRYVEPRLLYLLWVKWTTCGMFSWIIMIKSTDHSHQNKNCSETTPEPHLKTNMFTPFPGCPHTWLPWSFCGFSACASSVVSVQWTIWKGIRPCTSHLFSEAWEGFRLLCTIQWFVWGTLRPLVLTCCLWSLWTNTFQEVHS